MRRLNIKLILSLFIFFTLIKSELKSEINVSHGLSQDFSQKSNTQIVLEKIDLDRIRDLEAEFGKKYSKSLWLHRAVYLALVAGGLSLAAKGIYSGIKFFGDNLQNNSDFSNDSFKETDKILYEQAVIEHFKEKSSLWNYFSRKFLNATVIVGVASISTVFVKIFDYLDKSFRKCWPKETDWVDFYLKETVNNLENISHFLLTISKDSALSSLKFYYERLLFSIENYIASVAYELGKNNQALSKKDREWVLSNKNCLYEGMNKFTDLLELFVNSSDKQENISFFVKEKLLPAIDNLALSLELFKNTFLRCSNV